MSMWLCTTSSWAQILDENFPLIGFILRAGTYLTLIGVYVWHYKWTKPTHAQWLHNDVTYTNIWLFPQSRLISIPVFHHMHVPLHIIHKSMICMWIAFDYTNLIYTHNHAPIRILSQVDSILLTRRPAPTIDNNWRHNSILYSACIALRTQRC